MDQEDHPLTERLTATERRVSKLTVLVSIGAAIFVSGLVYKAFDFAGYPAAGSIAGVISLIAVVTLISWQME